MHMYVYIYIYIRYLCVSTQTPISSAGRGSFWRRSWYTWLTAPTVEIRGPRHFGLLRRGDINELPELAVLLLQPGVQTPGPEKTGSNPSGLLGRESGILRGSQEASWGFSA